MFMCARRWIPVAATLMVLLATAAGTATRDPVQRPVWPIDPGAQLDLYHRGRFDAALEPLRALEAIQILELRKRLTLLAGREWIDRDPADRTRRLVTAAVFVLDAERVHAERGRWGGATEDQPCAGRCAIEWACTLLRERGTPDDTERLWLLASVALAGGVRDWTMLLSPLTPPRPPSSRGRSARPPDGHALHAMARVPDEPRFALARAVAIASRVAIAPEMDAPRDGARTGPAASAIRDLVVGPEIALRPAGRLTAMEYALQQLSALTGDPAVGAEAQIRRASLQFRSGRYEAALADAREAAGRGQDADERYLGWYLAGQAAQTLGDLRSAEAHYAAALEARPHSQSATLALAALRFQRGDAQGAADLVDAALATRPRDDDPWRLFLYGDFPRLEGLMRALRARIGS
jgi:hypothetical protein